MLRDGKVCDSCITGTVFNAFRYRCQEGSAQKAYCSLEATWQYIAQNYQALDVIISPSVFYEVSCVRCQIRALMSSSMALMIVVPVGSKR
jgi:hypothetical protein